MCSRTAWRNAGSDGSPAVLSAATYKSTNRCRCSSVMYVDDDLSHRGLLRIG
jgi:hypothetical protein